MKRRMNEVLRSGEYDHETSAGEDFRIRAVPHYRIGTLISSLDRGAGGVSRHGGA
jgi:hypothetical protein